MKYRFFDFEVLPNWWLCVFGDSDGFGDTITEEKKKDFVVINSDMPDARDRLLKMLREPGYVMCGYNIKHYDLIIANGVYQSYSPRELKILSDIIINPSLAYSTKDHLRIAPLAKRKISGIMYQDMMDDNLGSLKEKETILGLDIEESTVPFDKEDLTDEDKADLTYYCKHDVFAAMYYFIYHYATYISGKLSMGEHFNIDERTCYSSTNAVLVAKALNAKHCSYDDENKIHIELPQKIKRYCMDNLPAQVLDHVTNNTSSLKTKLFNNTVDFSNGGLHSVLSKSLYVESNDEWVLVNADASSYYPSMMIQFGLLSRAIPKPEQFKSVLEERISLKPIENKTPEQERIIYADKLVLNTTFGASGNKYLALYDPYHCTKCCRVGQLFLSALANKIFHRIPAVNIIQTNTDGILLYIRRKYLPELQKLLDEWSTVSGLIAELEYVDKIWQKDVNNYIMIEPTKKGPKIKNRGSWLVNSNRRDMMQYVRPLSAYVSANAAIEWLINKKDIVKHIISCKDLAQFVVMCTKGPTFRSVIQRYADGTEVELFRCNRVIASKDSSLGKLYKIKMVNGQPSYYQMPNVPEYCKTVNKSFDTYDFNELRKEIDYVYYIERAVDLVNQDWSILEGTSIHKTDQFDYSV